MSKIKKSALDRFLEKHRRSCTYFRFSGDRHCSCGRDEAMKELEELRWVAQRRLEDLEAVEKKAVETRARLKQSERSAKAWFDVAQIASSQVVELDARLTIFEKMELES